MHGLVVLVGRQGWWKSGHFVITRERDAAFSRFDIGERCRTVSGWKWIVSGWCLVLSCRGGTISDGRRIISERCRVVCRGRKVFSGRRRVVSDGRLMVIGRGRVVVSQRRRIVSGGRLRPSAVVLPLDKEVLFVGWTTRRHDFDGGNRCNLRFNSRSSRSRWRRKINVLQLRGKRLDVTERDDARSRFRCWAGWC